MTTLAASPTWYTVPTTTVLADLRRGGLRVPYPLGDAFAGDLGQVETLRSSLVGQGAALSPAATTLIEIIARASVAVDLRWGPENGPELGALAVLAQERAAIICVTGATTRATVQPTHNAVAALLACLPPLPPVRMPAISYPSSLAADVDAFGLRDRPVPSDSELLRRLGTSAERLREALRTLRQPTATGQLGTTFDGPGQGRRGAQVIGIFDSPSGRAMVTTHQHGDGETWISIASAGPAQLLRATAGLLSD